MDKPVEGDLGQSHPDSPSEMEYKGSIVVRHAIIIIHDDGHASLIDVSPDGVPCKRGDQRSRVVRLFFIYLKKITNLLKRRY